jgi:hypothetical protein
MFWKKFQNFYFKDWEKKPFDRRFNYMGFGKVIQFT